MTRISKMILLLLIGYGMVNFSLAQYKPGKERGDPSKRAKGQLEGNQVRTTIQNYGLTGRTSGVPIYEQTPYEWPKNSGEVYLAMTQTWVGAEVTDNLGRTLHIIDIANGRTSPDNKSWNFEPVPGYYNDQTGEVASSSNPATWPAFWPDREKDNVDPGWAGSWNGLGGKNDFRADQELFYRASDDRYSKYTEYFPDSTDLTRKGLGIIMDVRALAWSQVLVQDAVYVLHTLRNDGTKDLAKVGFSMWYADFVGGNDDSKDDISNFDLIDDIAWSRDSDNKAPTFGNDPVGAIAVAFLETPGNAVDRIDNDGDSPEQGPLVTKDMLDGEIPDNLIDDNGNGLIDENETHIAFGQQTGVTFADGIGEPMDPTWLSLHPRYKREANSPVVTQEMLDQVRSDPANKWNLWPPLDAFQNGQVHLIEVTSSRLGMPYKDGIDNDGDGEDGSPTITQAMIDAAQSDPYHRYRVNSNIILYNVVQNTLGLKYADGIDNNGDGAIDEGIDDGIDVMIDEKRDDGIDNDYDWNPLTDDVGVDGVPNTGDYGENDGKPTSGARFGLPGEPSVDVTDVSETDQIGITAADYFPANSLNLNNDNTLWNRFFVPGTFYDPTLVQPGEYDLMVSSCLFPLKSGQSEPISLAIILANGPVTDPNGEYRKQEILRKKVRVQETYNNDYQFASAPLVPTLTAVPGDNKVTLHWDDIAERSFDKYIEGIGGNGYDFEGYRIYRSSDPAFTDATNITNGYGTLLFKTPQVIFDKNDGIKDFFPVDLDGVKFYIGKDSGLRHSWTDSTVKNGYTYYYAITSFDFGFPEGNIIPSECPIQITLNSDGTVKTGPNVAKVVPTAPSAGYVPATLNDIFRVEGTTSSTVAYSVVDHNDIKDGHVYFITFEDTLKPASKPSQPDTLTTKNFTLADSTAGTTLIYRSTNLASDYEQPLTDGFRLQFFNASRVDFDAEHSRWNDSSIVSFTMERYADPVGVKGITVPYDYEIQFGDVGFGTSTAFKYGTTQIPSQQTNFKVYNKFTQQYINFGFIEADTTGGPGKLSANSKGSRDRIVFIEPNSTSQYTWWAYLLNAPSEALGTRLPRSGDVLELITLKPFLSTDKFRFVASTDKTDADQARKDLDKIKVVPNPYVAAVKWEVKNPYTSGRGPRSLHFTHLPAKCTIRIFTVNGELVQTLEHDSALADGDEDWDMLSKDRLSISYGLYIYHIEAPGIGETIGKFAVIK